ncbi:MAG: molybdopterin molybdotransferase MoeA [Gordonibacter sp.]|uniref:molybdopterin molybdotransferase MoeA n=1 Tax=Gordonibacter sp. TaxID=1968902 RepID=UPI002FC86759
MKFEYEQSVERGVALQELKERWRPHPQVEVVPLDRAFGRVAAHEVHAVCSLPVKRSSKRDGIAVRAADFVQGAPDTRAWRRGIDYAQADTGDDFPDAFDAVIAVEDIVFDEAGGVSIINDALEVLPGAGVNPCGSIVREGSMVVSRHRRLAPESVAAAAMGGLAQIPVFARPKVAYLPTGSELVSWGSAPKRGQNIEVNSLMVAGMLAEWGAECFCYPVACDDEVVIDRALDRALEYADIVIVNGGSSRGEEDFNARLLQRRGTYFRHGVRAVPGRPVGMALVEGKPVVNVPGPMLAAFLCMDWLIRGLVAHFYDVPMPRRQKVRATITESVAKPKGFERLIRVSLAPGAEGGCTCSLLSAGLDVPGTVAASDAMLVLPIESEGVQAGAVVEVELLRPWEAVRASWDAEVSA